MWFSQVVTEDKEALHQFSLHLLPYILVKTKKQQSLFVKWGKTNCIQTTAVTERVQFKGRIDTEQKRITGK